jgi:hypothetical protein
MITPAQTPASTAARPEDLAELARLRAAFPGHLIGTETIVGRGVRYAARAHQRGAHPHTILTADLGELRAALEAGRLQPTQP